MQSTAPGLVNLYKAAAVSLDKKGLTGLRAAVYLVLDHSASMRRHYKAGTVQHLADQVLGLSANLDDDGIVPMVFFSTGVDGIVDINLANYSGRVEAAHSSMRWGGTNYAPAIEAVREHYAESGARDPAFVVFQTDGAPFDRSRTEQLLRGYSGLPMFWQFVGFGKERSLGFLRSLDTMRGRVVDNAGFCAAGKNPRDLSDGELYDMLMNEFPQWLEAATRAGVLRR
jgi:hypothetical protein